MAVKTDETSDAGLRRFHVSEHLANERTHLAYIRTAIALISFGITINRFSLYLLQSQVLPEERARHGMLRDAENVGFGMVLTGLGLIALAMIRFLRVDKEIDRGEFRTNRVMVWILSAAALIIGAFSVIWLFRR
ncbi:MAG: YidH family protein [Blastocatellia bacterium]